MEIVELLKEENILADLKDLKIYMKEGANEKRALRILKTFLRIEKFLLSNLEYGEKVYNIKELNEQAEEEGIENISSESIKTIINFWKIKGWIKSQVLSHSKDLMVIYCNSKIEDLKEKLSKRYELSQFILEYLYDKKSKDKKKEENDKNTEVVNVSVFELKGLFKTG